MKSIAIVTYNCLGDRRTLANGWHVQNDRRALLLQNTKGEGSREQDEIGAASRREQIGELWSEVEKALPELDHVVVYVGANGSQRAIALAAQLPPTKVTFVGCDCGLFEKEALVQDAGMGEARRILCECGGHFTLERMFRSYMETGELLAPD